MPPERATFTIGEAELTIEYRAKRDGTFAVDIGESSCAVELFGIGNGELDVAIDDRRVQMSVTAIEDRWLVHGPTGDVELTEHPRFPEAGVAEFTGGLFAPMPSKVISLEVSVGDKVEAGQLLMILEAMKMEHRITAPVDGTVSEINVTDGEQVDNGAMLVVLETEEEEEK
jgi:propionyl-CoA carboxylase alpha chain